jgi:hypothetical protein
MFGLPGDYNMGFLVCPCLLVSCDHDENPLVQDMIEVREKIDWVGNW